MTHHPEDSMITNTSKTSAPSGLTEQQILAALTSITHEPPQRLPPGWLKFAREIERAAIEQHVSATSVDYRLLLAKYIDHVGREEGTTFIGRCSAPEFTEAEVLALLAAEHVSATPAPARELTDADIARIAQECGMYKPDFDHVPGAYCKPFARAIECHITGTAGGSA